MRIRTGLFVALFVAWSVVGTFAQTEVTPASAINAAGDARGSVRFPASSYINFGATAGTSGYGIRDNAGTVQFKNSGDVWTDISVAAGATYWTRTGSELFTGTDGDSLVLGAAGARSKITPLGAGIIALRDATVAQEFRVYTTYAGADADYEYASLKGAAGSITLSAATLGTGTDDIDVVLTPAGTGAVRTTAPVIAAGTSSTFGAIATQDVLRLVPTTSATRFTGSISPIDFTEDHTIQLPDSSGIVTLTGDNFHRPHMVRAAATFAAKDLGNGALNAVLGSPIGIITYREEGTKSTSSWSDISGELSIVGDGAVSNDEGVEILFGDYASGSGWITTGAAAAHGSGCFEIHTTIALIAGTDQFLVGWRTGGAFDASNVYTNYADYSVVGLNNVDGSIFSLGGKGGTDTTDDSGVNAANGNELTLGVCIAGTTGVPRAYYKIGAGAITNITMTNTGAARTAGLQFVPFITYMHTGTTVNPGILISNVYITR